MVTVFPGWYIKIVRKRFLSKFWEVRLYDGFKVCLASPYMLKSDAENFAQMLLEDICKDRLELCKREQPEVFAQIMSYSDTVWDTQGQMGKIPIGKIALKLYPHETK